MSRPPSVKIGQRFGRLVLVGKTTQQTKHSRFLWEFTCDCGSVSIRTLSSVTAGNCAKSCGCLALETKGKASWKGCGDLSGSYFNIAQCNARRRGFDFSISIEFAWSIFNGTCALSGVPITLSRQLRNRKQKGWVQTASLDRIDSSLGYVDGNVQWIHKEINRMKWKMEQHEFIDWCKKIAQHHKTSDAPATPLTSCSYV